MIAVSRMIFVGLFATFATVALVVAADSKPVTDRPTDRCNVLVVVGAEGSKEFGPQFRQWAKRWSDAAERGKLSCQIIGLDEPGEASDRDVWQKVMETQANLPSSAPFWLVLIGHGTFDGKTAKFNLRGPDVSSTELGAWLKKIEPPLAVIHCASSSGPFLAELSGPNRVVITAARSGHEYNFAHFGDFMSTAITDPAADLDKDDQTSLLEAFLAASAKLREFYAADGRLATEHALIDDNGDRLGTPADWYQGLRAVKEAKSAASPDGALARQFVLVSNADENQWPQDLKDRRAALEKQLGELRSRKSKLSEAEYLSQIEPLLVEIAKLSDEAASNARSTPEKASP